MKAITTGKLTLFTLFCLLAASGCTSALTSKTLPTQTSEERNTNGLLLHTTSYYFQSDQGDDEMVLHGPQIDWNPDGSKRKETHFAHGVRDGEETQFDEKGQVTRKRQFVAGEKVGTKPATKVLGIEQPPAATSYRLLLAGVAIYEQSYDASKQVVGVVYRDATGINIARCVRASPDPRGVYHTSHWIYWTPDGDPIGTGVFRDDKPWDGICFVNHQEGSLTRQHFGRYHEGKLIETI
jgi:hypothetical protein